MVFAAAVFGFSLVAIVALLALKYLELAHSRRFAPQLRDRADSEALRLKELLGAAQVDAGKLPPLILHALQVTLHSAAIDFAHFAHWLGAQAHRLADTVSHKRHFERRETRSEFLKKVSEHKNGNSGDDTAAV